MNPRLRRPRQDPQRLTCGPFRTVEMNARFRNNLLEGTHCTDGHRLVLLVLTTRHVIIFRKNPEDHIPRNHWKSDNVRIDTLLTRYVPLQLEKSD